MSNNIFFGNSEELILAISGIVLLNNDIGTLEKHSGISSTGL
jgi:hypothetical protein